MKSEYQRRLGERLRAIRTQQDLTLQQVEERSEGQWKAVVIGAYERGDRAISATKLAELARFYGVPVTELLPEPAAGSAMMTPGEREAARRQIMLDLTKLNSAGIHPSLKPVSRYATTIQQQRGDYNGRVLTLRGDDVRALSVVFGVTMDDFIDRLATEGVLVS